MCMLHCTTRRVVIIKYMFGRLVAVYFNDVQIDMGQADLILAKPGNTQQLFIRCVVCLIG